MALWSLAISNSYNPVLVPHPTNGGAHHLHRLYPRPPSSPSSLFRTVTLRGHHVRTMRWSCKAKGSSEKQEEAEDVDLQLVSKAKSLYNDIMIVDSPHSRMLVLDSTYNIHSILYKDKKWTNSYWDEFASLPPIIPKGPVALLGLGGGTAAHLMLDLWPELLLEGWEIDQILIDRAREHFGLSDLEKPTKAGGVLNIRVGDALSPAVNIPGGYAGIVVDLFAKGDVLPELKEVTTWLDLKKLLMPSGRLMVNCGGTVEAAEFDSTSSLNNGSLVQNPTIQALSKAFPGNLSWKRKAKEYGANHMALTGPIPDLESWSQMVPAPLNVLVKDWIPFNEF